MHFQKINTYKYSSQKYLNPNSQKRNSRSNRNIRGMNYNRQREPYHNMAPSPEMLEYERRIEMSNDEGNPQGMYKSRSIIRSIKDNINEEYTPSQLVGDKHLSSALHNFSSRFGEEREQCTW